MREARGQKTTGEAYRIGVAPSDMSSFHPLTLKIHCAPMGLSLGDRACLALALELTATVYTTDTVWKSLPPDLKIEVIR
jgi:PIN domain nuclease of toxin-antitoxin system